MIKYFLFIFLSIPYFIAANDTSLISGNVQHINKKSITLNVGRKAGVVLGMVFDAYEHNKSYKLPLSGEIVVKEGKVIGKLKVVEVSDNFCICQSPEDFKPFLGQLTLGRGVPSIGNQAPTIENIKFNDKNIHWGSPLSLEVIGHDPEQSILSATGVAESGQLLKVGVLNFMWFPPKGEGQGKITIELSDGIAHVKKTILLNYKEKEKPLYVNPRVMIGAQRFSFNTIDQLVVDDHGNLWILDKNKQIIVTLSDSLYEIRKISLQNISPQRFSVSHNRVSVLGSKRVFIYSHDGKILSRVGNQGHKVHQWEEAGDILLLHNNFLAILDSERQTVILYNENGTFISCCGFPKKSSPGFLKATWLERHEKGFAVLDLDQRNRLIFDEHFRFKESLPLDKLTLPLSGPGKSRSFTQPNETVNEEWSSIARGNNDSWFTVDQERQRLWKFSNNKKIETLTWNTFSGDQRLTSSKDYVFWLNQYNGKLFKVNSSGWRENIFVPKAIENLWAYSPKDPETFLDRNNCRLFQNQQLFGQSGSGKGMLDEPDDILMWNGLTAVLDIDNEKVVLFKEKGLPQSEQTFDNCKSFCVNHKNELIVLCNQGKTWLWSSPTAIPSAINFPQGSLALRAIDKYYIVLMSNKVMIYNNNLQLQQQIFITHPKDAVLSTLGELWIFSGSLGLVKYYVE